MSLVYKEPDRAYIAKQFNGPIISAFFKAVYNFFHSFIDRHTDYFKSLSIETADTAQLAFIGKLMGVQLLELVTDPSGGMYLVFTEGAFDTSEFDYDNGWSSVYREYQSGDGVFGTGNEQEYPITLSTEQYRAILSAVSQVASAAVDSIYMIDLLAHVVLDSTDYNISYNHGFVDTVNVVIGMSITHSKVTMLQHMYDKLLNGGTVSVMVTHI